MSTTNANTGINRILNPTMNFLVGTLGLPLGGGKLLTVRGRKTGTPSSRVVNPLEYDGHTYLLAPRGETNWVKNLRATGECTLKCGPTSSSHHATEVTDEELRFEATRAYLNRWDRAVKSFMGVDRSSPHDQIREAALRSPLFRLDD